MSLIRRPLALLCLGWLFAASGAMAEPPSQAQALELQRKILTLDTHLDTPANFGNPDWSILDDHSASGRQSQVDYPRMVSGALDGGFWAIYTGQGPQTVEADLKARDHGLKRLIEIREMLAAHPDTFALALTADDAARIKIEGKRVVYISMENASPLVHDPSLLQFYYAQGLRLMSLVHFANNQLADSGTDPKGAQWNGLSPAGQALVAEANRLGIVLDQSHGSDAEFDALLALSKTPIILSHSGARAVYDHPRNIDDERLKRLAETGGVIQVNSYGGYLIDIPKDEARLQAEAELQQRFGDDPESLPAAQQDEYRAAWKAMNEAHPLKRASIDDFFRHLDHVLEVAGPEHVGIGMDWDGGGGVIGLDSVADLPKITSHLMEKGYSEAQIADIWGGNVLRVLRRAEAYAASGKTD